MIRRRTDYTPKRSSAEHKPAALGFGLTLHQLRMARGISMRAFARSIGIQAQQLWNWEHTRVPHPTDAAFIAGALRADYTTAQRIIGHARHADLRDLVDSDHREHAAIAWHYERLADHTTIWAPTLIPDLLRIPALDLTLLNHPLVDHDHADAHADAMPQRRADLADPRRRYTFLIGDTALHACPEHLRSDQLEQLATQAARPNITILQLSHQDCPPGLIDPFILFSKNSAAIAVAIHHAHATTYLTDRDTLTRYGATTTWLRRTASTIETSRPHNRQPGTPDLHEHPAPRSTAPNPVAATGNDRPRPSPSAPTPHLVTTATPTPSAAPDRSQSPQRRHPTVTADHAVTGSRSTATAPPPPSRPASDTPAPSMLGPHVAHLRTARELDVAQLAAATDISQSKLTRLERGIHIAFTLTEITALADVLGVARTDFATLAVADYSLRHGPAPA
ncbi:Scr1 family TA system antitoxin-like transcriptional regulator, partial [Amycolatopsis pretoriensis]